jgi:hypothetical protein
MGSQRRHKTFPSTHLEVGPVPRAVGVGILKHTLPTLVSPTAFLVELDGIESESDNVTVCTAFEPKNLHGTALAWAFF